MVVILPSRTAGELWDCERGDIMTKIAFRDNTKYDVRLCDA